MIFDHEKHQIDFCLILILAGILRTRPEALIEGSKSRSKNRVLYYRHVQVTLI
jgi:hypothetical protein